MFSRKKQKKINKNKSNNKKDSVSQISNESFKKLAKSNVQKSIKDYMIYFITLSFGVALLYSFNSIDNTLSYLMGNGLLDPYIYMSRGILGGFSIIICLIFGFLITYANNFLMKKRKREFGIYTTLGMDKRDLNKLMFKETTIIGTLSLAFGLILGIFASQGLSIITFKMINFDSSLFKFSISISAIIKTIILFGFVLFLVNQFNKRNIKKYKLIDLINANRRNENFIADSGIKNFIIFMLSILLIFGSYFMIRSLIEPDVKIISLCIILISFGTYLFFISASDFIVNKIKKRKGVYYKNLNMFVISQMSSRIKTMSLSVTVICLIISSSLIIIPFGMSFGNYFKQDINKITPFDVTIIRYNNLDDKQNYDERLYSNDRSLIHKKYTSLNNDLIESSFSYNDLISKSIEIKVYELKDLTYTKLFNNSIDYDYSIPLLSITDYNNIREQQNLEKITLKNNEFAINLIGSKKESDNLINNSLSKKLSVNNHNLKYSGVHSDVQYYNTNIPTDLITVIVPDNVVNNLYPTTTYLNLNYIKLNNEYDNKFRSEYYNFIDKYNDYSLRFESKLVIDGENISYSIISSFISIYIGIILLISAGAVLALQQISESTVNKERFNILRKLGVKESDIKKSILIQVLTFFIIPLALALLHTIFVSNVLFEIILELSTAGIYKNILISSVIVAVIYSSYFFVSYYESLNIISNKKNI